MNRIVAHEIEIRYKPRAGLFFHMFVGGLDKTAVHIVTEGKTVAEIKLERRVVSVRNKRKYQIDIRKALEPLHRPIEKLGPEPRAAVSVA